MQVNLGKMERHCTQAISFKVTKGIENDCEMEQDLMVLVPYALCLSFVCGKTLAKE